MVNMAALDELNDKQRMFVERYLQCWNATQAAKDSGYSPDSAYQLGWLNLRHPAIKAAIAERIAEAAMSADEVLARLAEQARADMSDFLKVNGRVTLDLKQAAARDKLHLIKKYQKGRNGVTIELVDAQAALQLLGKHLGLLHDRVELTGADGGPIETHSDAIDKLFGRLLPDPAPAGETDAAAEPEPSGS